MSELAERRHQEFLRQKQAEMACDIGTLALAGVSAGLVDHQVNEAYSGEMRESLLSSTEDSRSLGEIALKHVMQVESQPTILEMAEASAYSQTLTAQSKRPTDFPLAA